MEYPQFLRLNREQQNRRHSESMRLDCIEYRPKPDLLQEGEEEVDHHLPLQNAWEEQIQMIILHPARSGEGRRHRRHWRAERRLAPARLNLPIFCSMDANADVTYEIWRFDVQGWLDQYDEVSMCTPHLR